MHSDAEIFLDVLALLFTAAAAFGYVNHRLLRLPHTIGLVVVALAVSLVILAAHAFLPGWEVQAAARGLLAEADVSDILLEALLSFLLFAGALNVNLPDLLERKWSIALLATAGVLISMSVVAVGTWVLFPLVGIEIPLVWCFVFGALIAPTDPIAVLGILRKLGLPRTFTTLITGESLFNDGVAIVVFTIAVAVASGDGDMGVAGAAELFALEAGGGLALGFTMGYAAFWVLRSIDEHDLEVLITLALVTVTYAAALRLHVSGPLAVVVAGVFIGNHGTRFAMSERTSDHVLRFWSVIDEIMNSVLFVIIGFELLAITYSRSEIWAALIAIPLVLAARAVSIAGPLKGLGLVRDRPQGSIPFLIWGGLHGGISVALALAAPPSPHKGVILAATYAVVLFSIIVQGLTIERVAAKVSPQAGADGGR
jgi:CPA1 family monovalent cation:H+ antiporter